MNTDRSAALVRRWVSLYTRGLPEEVRQNRRDEIDDDLWCQAQEAMTSGRPDRSLADEIVARFVLGIPADMSWRVEQGLFGKKPVMRRRRLTMHAPGRGLLAIIGGAGWAISLVPRAIVGRDFPTEGVLLSLLMFGVVGTWALAAATAGLALAAQDRVRAGVAVFAAICALISVLSMGGAYGAIVALPLGSAALLWELGRSGTVGAWLSRLHAGAAILAVVAIGAPQVSPEILKLNPTPESTAITIAVLSLALPYAVSWIAIGWGLLRDTSVPQETPAGA